MTCGDTMDNLQVLLQEALRMALCAAPPRLAQTTWLLVAGLPGAKRSLLSRARYRTVPNYVCMSGVRND